MKKLLTFIVGAFLAASAFAQSTLVVEDESSFSLDGIGVHLVSHHFPALDRNNVNPGLYFKFTALGVDNLVVGGYKNSFSEPSYYFGKSFKLASHSDFSLDIVLGVVTGYPTHYKTKNGVKTYYATSKVLPLMVPSLAYALTENNTARLSVIPKLTRHSETTAVHLSLEHNY